MVVYGFSPSFKIPEVSMTIEDIIVLVLAALEAILGH